MSFHTNHETNISLILLGAGSSSRFELPVKKQWLYSKKRPLWLDVAQRFESMYTFDKIIIVSSSEEIAYMRNFAEYEYTEGGGSRQVSLRNALENIESEYVLVSDIARPCIPLEMTERIINAKNKADCIIPVLPVTDTLYMEDKALDREKIKIIQTPQLSKTAVLKQALQGDTLYTDDSSAIVAAGGTVHFAKGSHQAHKLTTIEDLERLPCIHPPYSRSFAGFGLDTHPFDEGKRMYLCGIYIDVPYGFKAHSDGDVAIHALIDALLGAAGMGDIGELYPDDDPNYQGADSTVLLADTIGRIHAYGFDIDHVDLTIIAEAPRLSPYKQAMRKRLADLLCVPMQHINIKATTSEGLGFVGRKEGVTVHAVATLGYFDWKEAQENIMKRVNR